MTARRLWALNPTNLKRMRWQARTRIVKCLTIKPIKQRDLSLSQISKRRTRGNKRLKHSETLRERESFRSRENQSHNTNYDRIVRVKRRWCCWLQPKIISLRFWLFRWRLGGHERSFQIQTADSRWYCSTDSRSPPLCRSIQLFPWPSRVQTRGKGFSFTSLKSEIWKLSDLIQLIESWGLIIW